MDAVEVPVEMAFERIEMRGPELTEWRQPGIHLLEWFRFEPVQTALCIHRGFYEASLTQHAQVFGYGRLRHAKLPLNVPHGLIGRDEKTEDCAAIWLSNNSKRRFHITYILVHVYTCQGILFDPASKQRSRARLLDNLGPRPPKLSICAPSKRSTEQ